MNETNGQKNICPNKLTPKNANAKIAGLFVLVIILIAVYIHNLRHDAQQEAKLSAINVQHPDYSHFVYIESLKANRTKKTNAAILLGFIRGAIIAGILGGDGQSFEAILSFGTLNGILFWVSEHINENI